VKQVMKTRFTVFIFMASILTMAIFSSITNFVSAVTTCEDYSVLGGSICVTFDDDKTTVQYCSKDKDGIWSCIKLNPKPTPPGIEQAIQDTVKEEAQTNTNDSKDLGGMKSDKGIMKSPLD